MNVTRTKFIGYILILCALILAGTVMYRNSQRRHIPLVFAPKSMLVALWRQYTEDYLEPDTYRTLDKQRSNITTSEGQSYTMMRAVWMDDHLVFDQTWQWTKDNLQIDDSHLFSWIFGQRRDGTYGILTEMNGQNTASDADTDIAMSLLFAYARWKDPKYIEQATDIIRNIWNEEVVIINGRPYMAANNVEKDYDDDVLINPSYFAPYAYRIFAEIDPGNNWEGVIDTSYEILEASMNSRLDREASVGLPPNWMAIDRATGAIKPPPQSTGLDTNYSYDALRTSWRIALDWQWYAEPRAKKILSGMNFLSDEWGKNEAIYAEYSHDGKVLVNKEIPAMYGGSLGSVMVVNSVYAKDIYERKLQSLYNPDAEDWKIDIGYYDNNLAWFGMALYNNELPNLWETANSQNNNTQP